MLDSGGVIGEAPRLVEADFDRSPEGFRALGSWASDLWIPSLVGDYSDFRTSLRAQNLGSGLLIEWRSAPIQLYRSPAHVAHGNLDFYRIVLNLAGDHHTTFGTREDVPLLAGDIGIFDEGISDHTTMGEAEPGGAVQCIVLMVPRARMAPLLRHPDSIHASVIPGDTPFGRFVSAHFLSIWRNASLLTTAESEAAVQSFVTLVAGGVGSTVDADESTARAARRALLSAIHRHIGTQLGSADLTADALCRQFGLSRATLFRLFEPEGGLAHHIQQRRLDRAFVMLSSPAYRHWRIIDIALEANFSSDATFSRAFRQTFNLTPGDVRRMSKGDIRLGGGSALASGQSILPWIRQLAGQAARPAAA